MVEVRSPRLWQQRPTKHDCSTKLTTQTALPNCPSKLTSSQADLIGQQGKRRLYFSGLYIEFSTRVPLDPTFACI